MKLSSLKIFALKLAIFGSALAYMAFDLFLWQGPLWRTLHGSSATAAAPDDTVAQVYGERISTPQFERHMAEQNRLRGSSEPPAPGRRAAMLMELVRGTLLRMRARYNDKNLPDFSAEAEAEVQRLASRASGDEAFEEQLTSQGYTRKTFTLKLHAILKEAALLTRAVEPLCRVSDADVAKHYEILKDQLILPEQRPLKHIFFSCLGKDTEEVRSHAQDIMNQILSGEADFESMAKAHSEDTRTAPIAGDLGLISHDDHFPLPELPLFGEGALPAGQLALAQSHWGWHILLPGEITPSRQLSLDETRESLRSAIQSAQYELAVQDYLSQAVREAFHHKHLKIKHAR